MKIVFVADEDQNYGAAKSLFELVTSLTQMFNVKIIVFTCNYGVLNQKFTEQNIENYVIGHAPFLVNEGSTKVKRLIKKLLKFFLFLIYRYKNIKAYYRAKKLIDFNEVDLIYTNVNRIDFGVTLSKKFNVPHIWHIREFGDSDYRLFSFRKDYIKFMNKNTDKFIAISKAVYNSWIKKGIDKTKINLVYNGIDFKRINLTNVKKVNNERVKIVFTGSINDTKQQIQLIEALRILPKDILNLIHIDFYGSGTKNYLSYLFRKIKQYSLEEYVSFKGYNANVTSILSEYDVGIICSRSEGFGRVTVEYMASGLCVIASNTGANCELILDKKTGILYKYGDIIDLANKITYIVKNKEECLKIGEYARENAIANFSKEKNASQIYSIIKDVLED